MLGLINIPLAIPALLNIAYSKHSRARTGWSIVAVAFVLVNLGLFTGGMMFMLSGRTFEEFSDRLRAFGHDFVF